MDGTGGGVARRSSLVKREVQDGVPNFVCEMRDTLHEERAINESMKGERVGSTKGDQWE